MRVWVFGAMGVLGAIGLLLALLGTGERGLEHSFAVQSWLSRHAAVTTLEAPGAAPMPMFLNANDPIITPRIQARLFEPRETQLVLRGLRPGDTFVDVGANVGYYTLIAAQKVGEQGRVVAFEPDPESFSLLERNVALNRLTNVVLEQKAVSHEPGSILLYLAPENKGDHRIYDTATGTPAERESISIEAVTLDDYFEGDADGVDFVKIDVQGADMAVLEGMTGILDGNPDLLLSVEFWPWGLRGFGDDPAKMLQMLTDRDFRLFDMRSGEASADWLLHHYGHDEHLFTNLLLMRGRAEVEELRASVDHWTKVVEENDSVEARAELARLRSDLEARLPNAANFPRLH